METTENENIFTFAAKVTILTKIISGTTMESIADLYQTNVAEINKIHEAHSSIIEVVHLLNKSRHLALRGGLYPEMENLLFCWFVEQQSVTNKQLAAKAKAILDIVKEPSRTSKTAPVFRGSNGWVNGFKTRYGIPVVKRKFNSSTAAIPEPGPSSSEHEETGYHSPDEESNGFMAAQMESAFLSNEEDMDTVKTEFEIKAEPEMWKEHTVNICSVFSTTFFFIKTPVFLFQRTLQIRSMNITLKLIMFFHSLMMLK